MRKYQKLGLATNVANMIPKNYFELSDNQVLKLKNFGEVLLALTAVAGVATVAIVAPNAIQLLGKIPKIKKFYRSLVSKEEDSKKNLANAFYYIKRKEYVKLVSKGGEVYIKVTAKGREKLKQMEFRALRVPKEKWDGKWWFIMADIPTEPFRENANRFRRKLKDMSFYPMQRTVWVYPFDPRDEIDFISAHYGINRYVTVLQAAVVEGEDEENFKSWFKKQKII